MSTAPTALPSGDFFEQTNKPADQWLKAVPEPDGARVLRAIPEKLRAVLESYGKKIAICGGFVRDVIARKEPSDLDIFCSDVETANSVTDALSRDGIDTVIRKQSSNTILSNAYRCPIQVIKSNYHENAWEAIRTFDFTFNVAAVWFENCFHCHTHIWFYEHLASRSIVPTHYDQDCGNLLARTLKFTAEGYVVSRSTLASILVKMYEQIQFDQSLNALSLEKKIESKLRSNYATLGNKQVSLEETSLTQLVSGTDLASLDREIQVTKELCG
jgi:hypothetical protein